MNKKLINEDIKNMKYLLGYKPGRVISEQEQFDNTGYWTQNTTMDSPKSQDDKETLNSPLIQDLFPNRKEPKWTPEKISQEASKYETKKDFRLNSFNVYQQAYIKKMLDDLFPNKPEPKWTPEKIAQEASKYKTAGEFRKENFNVYQQASNKKMLDDLFPNNTKRIKWTPELVRQEASKYNTRSEFRLKSPSAYQYASKNGMLKKLSESNLTKIIRRVIKEQELDKRISSNNTIKPKTNDPFELILKRRLSTIEDLINKYVNEVEEEGTYFSDEFEFADNIISWVVDDINAADEQDYYKLVDYIKDNFGEYLLSRYTEPNDEDFDF